VVGWKDELLVGWAMVPGLTLKGEARGVVRGALGEFADEGVRVEGYALERGRLWLCVRARSRRALSLGMRRLAARLVQGLNRRFGRRGPVFAGRYEQWLTADLERGDRRSPPVRILARVLRPPPAA